MGNGVFAVPGGRRTAVWYAGFAVYAAGVALLSGPGLDHWWGAWAAGGYGLAALATAAGRDRLGLALSMAGALAAPAIWLVVKEPITPDAAVVARSGVLLLHHGTPYLPVAALSAGWLAYNPYLPVMALFGLPGALGVPGGTRPWLVAATFLLLYATFRVTLAPASPRAGRDARTRPGALATAAFWLACPIMAFPLAMGITDPPVIALTCLSLALLARTARTAGPSGRVTVTAALVLGVACAMKYTAWPALAIIAVMVAARDGRRAAARFTGMALATAAALVVALAPGALRHPASIVANTVAYPLGLTTAKSPAQSPLPGHLLATLGAGGHLAALLLLAAAGLATAASLVIAPPATPATAARRIAVGLTALFALSPATRFGYFIYPIALYAWAWLASRPAGLTRGPGAAVAERRGRHLVLVVLARGRAKALAAVTRGVHVPPVAARRAVHAKPGVPLEGGVGTRVGEHLVDPAGRPAGIRGGEGGQDGVQPSGDRDELCGCGFGDLTSAACRSQ